MDKIILLGSGGHAHSCIDVIEMSNQFEIAGLIDKDKEMNDGILGYPIIGTDNILQDLRQKYSNALITVGQIKSPEIRIKLYRLLKELDFTLPVIISPKAYVSKHAKLGNEVTMLPYSSIIGSVSVGDNVTFGAYTLVNKDCADN